MTAIISPGPPSSSAMRAGGITPMTKPMLGMKLVTKASTAHTNAPGTPMNRQGYAVEDRNDESEPCGDAHVAAGAAREAGKRGREVGHPLAQDGQAAAGGVGVEGHEEQQDVSGRRHC